MPSQKSICGLTKGTGNTGKCQILHLFIVSSGVKEMLHLLTVAVATEENVVQQEKSTRGEVFARHLSFFSHQFIIIIV